ncbi:MGH1-like glycoside hydrolase domain-containing protein [Brevundimonas sp.]|uniref:MGH1-like glycoside hydrolase domain-containing protein n=1 Tax=Brevundimonas sp. TaxID=1871086 RepID=UPI0028976E59|nr:trehalase family glycosidase [Brevundimonas sp.]
MRDEDARSILIRNDRGGYTVPNGRVYPFQWNWDSAFVALGFTAFDLDRAWREIESLFEAQWPDGFVPHIVFWKDDPGYFPGPDRWDTKTRPLTSGITQPPVAATVVRDLWMQGGEQVRDRMAALFPKLMAWTRWFRTHRDFEGRGLVVALHPWETGRDNSPEWDEPGAAIDTSDVAPYQRRDTSHLDAAMRPTTAEYDRYVALVDYGRERGWDHARLARENPFRVADVGMTMILLRADRDLLALAEALGRDAEAEELRGYIARAEQGVDWLWNAEVGAYCSRDVLTGRSSGFVTSASFLGFYAGLSDPERDKAVLAALTRIGEAVRYLVPSLDPHDPGFQMIRYWRGPVWAVLNYMIGRGLEEAGQEGLARRVREDTRDLIRQSGFYEAFDPTTGAPTGGDDFSWTAAVWLCWAGR